MLAPMRSFLLLVTCALVAGCGGDSEPKSEETVETHAEPTATADPAPAHGGEALYQRYCALCHGDDAQGYAADNAPSLISQELLRSASDAFLTAAIADGRPGTPMSAFSERRGGPLDEGEIGELVAFMRSKQREPRVLVDGVRVEGDATRGSEVYAAQCAECHGARGEGVTAVALANPTFLETASDGFIQYAISHGRTGTPMTAFAGRLTPQQIDDVVTFVRALGDGRAKPPAVEEPPPRIPTLTEMDLVTHPDGPQARFILRDERYVPAAQVAREFERGAKMVLIDARPTSDWLTLRIPGAVPVPYYELSAILDDLPRDGTWMIAYCACPHAASGRVVDALRERGFRNTAVLDEGIHHWEQQGYPTATGAP